MNKLSKIFTAAACAVIGTAMAVSLAACNETPEEPAKTLTSISLQTSGVTTTFTVGDQFTAEGLQVTAKYSDDSEKIVTEYTVKAYQGDTIVNLNEEFTVAGQYSAEVTYEGKEASYSLTVSEADTRVHVSSAADLVSALASDCEIVLDGNIETDEHFTVDHTVSIDLNGKTITQTEEKENALFEVTGKLTVTGEGTVSAKHYVFRVGANPATDGEIVLESGTYTTESASVLSMVRGSAEIKGGDYSVTYSGGDKWLVNGQDENLADIEITVTGGTFHGFDPSDKTISDCTIPEDYICKKGAQQDSANKDVYTVSALQVKEVGTFAQLKDAVADDCLIKLTANIEDANDRIEITKHIVLDLNGKTLKGTVQSGKGTLIWVKDGELYVKGEGTVESVNGYTVDVGSQNYTLTGKLVIEGGIFKAGNAATVVQVEKGIAQIKGGEFSVTEDAYGNNYVLNCIDNTADANIEVTGGKFYKFNPAEADNHDGGATVKTNYVQSGYSSAADGEYYTVSANVAG